jgi:hypothetical protein
VSKNVRVSALAEELNMSTEEVVALCNSIGIRVSSASSNMVGAQADRVRRHAEERGLKREAPPVKPQRAPTPAVVRKVLPPPPPAPPPAPPTDEPPAPPTE